MKKILVEIETRLDKLEHMRLLERMENLECRVQRLESKPFLTRIRHRPKSDMDESTFHPKS